MKDIQNLQIEDYIQILKRRILWILIPGIISGAATFLHVRTLPNVYVSETVILVEPPKIPTEYVKAASIGTVQSRLSTISQQIMSRTRLEKIILDNNLYTEARKASPMEEVVEAMRKDLTLTVTKTDAFTLSYRSFDPLVAQRVTSQIASLYIEENLKVRSEQTEGVAQFLESQLKETETKLRELEDQMSGFKMRNLGALPEQQTANLAALNRLQLQLQSAADTVNRLEEKKSYTQRMSSELAALAKFRTPNSSRAKTSEGTLETATVPVQGELEKKKAERDGLLARYTADHPDVRKLDKEIAALEKQAASTPSPAPVSPLLPVPVAVAEDNGSESDEILAKAEAQAQLDAIDIQIRQSKQEQDRLRREMGLFQARVDSVPKVEQLQKEISRDYDIMRQHYQTLLAKKNDAQMASSLERRQKGEQFRILDPAGLPERPAEPNRLRLNLMGLAAGLCFGFLLSLFLELRDDSVRSEHELALLTQLPVLVSVPLLSEPYSDEARHDRSFLGRLVSSFRREKFDS